MRLWLILALCSSGLAATIRVGCGSSGGVDAAGNVWQGDGPYFTGGATWAMTGQQFPYNNLRFSNPAGSPISYSIPINPPLTAGQYIVTLKFIEPNVTAVGKRRFSVSINGVQVAKDLDLFAVVGLLKPYDLTFPVTASGVISIVLTPTSSTDKAVISGIQIDDVAVPPVAAGATTSAQLGDFMAVRTDAQTLTIGPLGNVAVSGIVYNFTGSVTATLSAGSGTLYLYVDPSGILTAGHNLTLACSSVCGSLLGVTAFPPGSVPLWSWTATNGAWDVTGSVGGVGGVDYRAFLSGSNPPYQPVTFPPVQPFSFVVGTELPASTVPPCPATGLAFFFATDTSHLLWCSSAYDSVWRAVGNVLNFVPPKVVALETCSGSGGAGSNCAGLYHAAIGLQDGTQISLIGPDMALPLAPLTTWTPVK